LEIAVDLSSTPHTKIMEAIHRGDLREKRALIESITHQPSDRAVHILSEILEGESWYLRDMASKAMARMGGVAVPRLSQLCASGLWYTRAAAVRALGRMGHTDSLPVMVRLLADPNLTVHGAALASIADLVRAGRVRETARLFWNEGARRAEELGRILLDVHPDAGRLVMESLSNPASFLEKPPPPAPVVPDIKEAERKNA
jgi:HEAT repeat protein